MYSLYRRRGCGRKGVKTTPIKIVTKKKGGIGSNDSDDAKLQLDAYNLFADNGDNLLITYINEVDMDLFHRYISKYNDYMITLNHMLENCEPLLTEEALADEKRYNPDFENIIVYYIYDYEVDGENYIPKSRIDKLRKSLNEKMKEYNIYLNQITVRAGVALALLRLK